MSGGNTMRSQNSWRRRDRSCTTTQLLACGVAVMTILSDLVLTESKSVCDNQLERMTHDSAQSIFNRIKSLYSALWKGVGTATTSQMADFYEVSTDSVQKVIQRIGMSWNLME